MIASLILMMFLLTGGYYVQVTCLPSFFSFDAFSSHRRLLLCSVNLFPKFH